MLLVYFMARNVSELRVAGSTAGHCRCFNRPMPNLLLNLLIATGMITLTAAIHFFGIVALLRLRRNCALVRLVPSAAEKRGKRNSSQNGPAFRLRIGRREYPVQAWARCRILRREVNPNLGLRRNVYGRKWQFFQSSRSHGVHSIYASVRGCPRNGAHTRTPQGLSHRGLSVYR